MDQMSGLVCGRAAAARIRRLVAAGFGAVFLAGMGSIGPAEAQSADKIRTGGQFPPIFEYVYRNFAIEGGFLAEQGIEAEFVGFTAGLTGTQALVGGSVDFACDGLSGTIAAIEQGAGSKVVVNVNADNTYVIVARDTIGGPGDIAGKTWAISQMGAISQTYAQLWLDHYGIESVEWVPIGGTGARARALIAGQVEATMLTIGEWLRVQNQPGIKFVEYLADVVPPLPLSLCSASAKVLAERPDIVQRYVNGVLNAVRFARTPEGYEKYVETARLYDEGAVSPEEYAELVEVYLGPEGNPFAVDPNGGMYPEVLVANMKSMVADGTMKEILPLSEVWDPSFVNNYIGENGWFNVSTGTGGHTLRDLIRR
jgi:NitT/TauT family transport system substrate-binding protein